MADIDGLNGTPSGERLCIGFFGLRNAGKSSLVNALLGQDLCVVSDVAGTTTDPVRKAMELLPLGPVSIVDTPGLDDVGELGELRVRKARAVLRGCDAAVLVVDASLGLRPIDEELIGTCVELAVPFVVAWNKVDTLPAAAEVPRVPLSLLGAAAPASRAPSVVESAESVPCAGEAAGAKGAPPCMDAAAVVDDAATRSDSPSLPYGELAVSALEGTGIEELKELIGRVVRGERKERRLLADLLQPNDAVVLVIPIDAAAPKGRIILPQQMALRDCLDAHARVLCCQPSELEATLGALRCPPRLVVSDSQVFAEVASAVPEQTPLTSFSILMARYKGQLDAWIAGAQALSQLQDGDVVLVSEGCTHHRQCDDIGTVKLPRMIEKYGGAKPEYHLTSGSDFPDDLSGVRLLLHCGACMLKDREVTSRVQRAQVAGVDCVNYGIAIAHMNGLLDRALRPLRKAK